MFEKRKIGIALSGGAARGLSHIGVIQVLEEIGVEINAVAGCSMGAIVGAVYCAGHDLKDIEKYIASTDWKNFLMFSMFSLSRSGLVNDKKVDDVLKKFLGDITFDDCKKQFCCVAADLITGKKVVLNSGSVRKAVRASIAVPGLFPPVSRDNWLLIDGGVIEPLPTEAIKTLDANYIIASSIVFEGNNPGKISKKPGKSRSEISKKLSMQAIIDKSLNMVHAQMVKSYMNEAQIVIEPRIGDFGFFDFAKGKEIIEAGRIAAVEKIPEIKKKLRLR
jgi:NTE family protein